MFAMFDLPVDSREARRRYVQFRNALLKEGFSMLQFSIYARYFPSEETARPYRQRIKAALPPEGQVRLLVVTEKQFGRQEVYLGRKKASAEKGSEQFLLF